MTIPVGSWFRVNWPGSTLHGKRFQCSGHPIAPVVGDDADLAWEKGQLIAFRHTNHWGESDEIVLAAEWCAPCEPVVTVIGKRRQKAVSADVQKQGAA